MWHVFSSLSCFSKAHTVGCDFQKVKCVHPECGILVKKTSLPHHLKKECEFRVVTCELCHSQVVFCKLKVRCLLGVGICWLVAFRKNESHDYMIIAKTHKLEIRCRGQLC